MRQRHRPGEKIWVDFAGATIRWRERDTGREHFAQVFVAGLGVSSYVFVIAVGSQGIEDWIYAHERMYAYFGGVTPVIVPDNLKSAVLQVRRQAQELVLNPTYQAFIRHYGSWADPARGKHPKDKAKAEVNVQVIQRWIVRTLHGRQFFSLAEINDAIAPLLEWVNEEKPWSKPRDGSTRRTRFEATDQPLLKPLPATPFEYATFTKVRKVPKDYLVTVEGHDYSVPCTLVGQPVYGRATATTVEIFHLGKRVASHARSHEVGGFTRNPDHEPEDHRRYEQHSPAGYRAWALTVGPSTVAVVEALYAEHRHPQPATNACAKLRWLQDKHQPAYLEEACQLALVLKSPKAETVRAILANRLRLADHRATHPQLSIPLHTNLRGADHFRLFHNDKET
jgi:transposase